MSVPVVLIPGAGGQGWGWHLVEADLRRRGYDAFAADLPAADESQGLPAYADAVVTAIGDRTPVAIAAYSLGAFTAPLVWQRVPYFLHDVPAGLAAGLREHDVPQSGGPFGDVCAFDRWPDVPVHVIAGRDDRFFPVELQRRVARERLGIEPEVVPGGHLAPLSQPEELAAALARYLGAL